MLLLVICRSCLFESPEAACSLVIWRFSAWGLCSSTSYPASSCPFCRSMLGMPNLADAKAGSHQGFAPTPLSHGRMEGSTAGESASPPMLPGWRLCVSSNCSPPQVGARRYPRSVLGFLGMQTSGYASPDGVVGLPRRLRPAWAPKRPSRRLVRAITPGGASTLSAAFALSVPLLQTVERVATRFVLKTCCSARTNRQSWAHSVRHRTGG